MHKKLTAAFILMIVFLVHIAYAHEEDLEDPGILPDSPFYGLKKAAEKVGSLLVFKKVAKAERHLMLAERRLAEAKALAEKGKTEKVKKVLEESQRNIEIGNEISELARLIKDDKEKVAELVALATSKHLKVLDSIKKEVPEDVKVHIEKAKEDSKKKYERALRHLAKQNAKRTARLAKLVLSEELESVSEEGEELEESDFDDLLEIAEESAEGDEEVLEAVAEELEELAEIENETEEKNVHLLRKARQRAIERQREIIKKLSDKDLEKAVEVHKRVLEKKLERLAEKAGNGLKVDDDIGEVEDGDELSKELEEKAKELGLLNAQQRISEATLKRIEILSKLVGKIPPKASERLEKNIERLSERREKLLQDFERKIENLEKEDNSGSGNADDVKKERKYCEKDDDCVRATCCHPTETINKGHKPACEDVVCTKDCRTALDCGSGEPACIENKCSVKALKENAPARSASSY